jgi:hypothetical protein
MMNFSRVANRLASKTRIQHVSGLYVDAFETSAGAHFVKPVAPILVLNGGIGRGYQLRQFIQHCARNWDHVLYVPGDYELMHHGHRIGAEHELDVMLADFPNAQLMTNYCAYIRSANTYFLGTPYLNLFDKWWLRDEMRKLVDVESNVVIISSGTPLIKRPSLETTPLADAWLFGGKTGGASISGPNGTIYAYNARGHIARENDFSGAAGWRRDAYISIGDRPGHADVGLS